MLTHAGAAGNLRSADSGFPAMKIAFVTDLHGVHGLYRALRLFCIQERPDALLCGGDMLPDGKRPRPQDEPARFVREQLEPFLSDLRGELPQMRVLTVAGNHDWRLAFEEVENLGKAGLIEIPNRREPVALGGLSVFGYPNVPMTPFWVKDFERLDSPDGRSGPFTGRCFVTRDGQIVESDPAEHFATAPSIAEELDDLPGGDGIWIMHSPPHGTFADMMYGPVHVGSRAVREFIETRRPRITLHGHIHEAPAMSGTFADVIGRTLVINPGRTYDSLDAVVFDTADPEGTLRHTRFGMWRD
jgi:Icc-related predicted phosphoesterase